MAKKFKMYIDEKQTIWQRHWYEVTAKTQAEANKLIKEEMDGLPMSDEEPVAFQESEFLFETAEYMLTKDNAGNPTREAFTDDGDEVANNA